MRTSFSTNVRAVTLRGVLASVLSRGFPFGSSPWPKHVLHHLPRWKKLDNQLILRCVMAQTFVLASPPHRVGVYDFQRCNIQQDLFQLSNLSNDDPTFHNGDSSGNGPETEKYDWVVGQNVETVDVSVNKVDPWKRRWPNKTEGSDHTATRLVLRM